uniref:RING-type E3 ubiquitin transferase n=1 Tax=Oryza barthii TaxID=65489 RepID=A0A0D3FBD8_9ORYZ
MGKDGGDPGGGGGGGYPLVAVCIDKDKNSQNALKYATESLAHKGQTIVLVHDAAGYKQPSDPQMKDLFLPFRCFCTRKDIHCKDVVLDDHDVSKAIVEFAAHAAIEKLVVGATARGGFVRFKAEISSSISKTAPDFSTVYVVSKGGKVTSVRQAVRQAPAVSPLRTMIQGPKPDNVSTQKWTPPPPPSTTRPDIAGTPKIQDNFIMSPFARGANTSVRKAFPDYSMPESSDISFISSGPRRSLDRYPPRLSSGSDAHDHHSFEATRPPSMWGGDSFGSDSQSSNSSFASSLPMEDMEAEMKRLRLELKQTMDMYSTACKEALTAKQKAMELQRWKTEEEQRSHETRLTEESAMALIEQEKAKARAAIEAAEASQRLAEMEAQKRISAEMKALKETEERLKSMGGGGSRGAVRYRKYTIEEIELATEHFADGRKIGEGGYGPVYKGHLDHTPVAIKVLRPDAAQGRSQFQQEVEVLSCIRHPNMVLLLGACPEYGCLTGMLGVKSDVYSLGVMLLQIITAKPPMGLTHHVARALDHGTIVDMLDPAVHDWPVDEARCFAEISIRCCELRRKDRPDLATVVLPELNRLRALGEDNMQLCNTMSGGGRSSMHSSPYNSNSSMHQPHRQTDMAIEHSVGRSSYDADTSQQAMQGRRLNYN